MSMAQDLRHPADVEQATCMSYRKCYFHSHIYLMCFKQGSYYNR